MYDFDYSKRIDNKMKYRLLVGYAIDFAWMPFNRDLGWSGVNKCFEISGKPLKMEG